MTSPHRLAAPAALLVAILRSAIAALFFLPAVLRARVSRWSAADLQRTVLCGLAGTMGYHVPVIYGARWVPAGITGLLVATEPAWIALLSMLIAGERLAWQVWAGLGVAAAGVAGVVGWGDLDAARHPLLPAGAGLILLGALMWAAYSVAVRPLSRAHGALASTGPTTLAGIANVLWGASYLAARVALKELPPPLMGALRFNIACLLLWPLLLAQARRGGDWRPAAPWRIQRTDLPRLLGLGLVGVAALVLGNSGGGRGGGLARVAGDGLIMAGLLAESVYTVLGVELSRKYGPVALLALVDAASLLIWFPTLTWYVASGRFPPIGFAAAGGVLYLALVNSLLCPFIWFKVLPLSGSNMGAISLLAQPLVGAILGIGLLNEPLTLGVVVGGCLVMLALYFGTLLDGSPIQRGHTLPAPEGPTHLSPQPLVSAPGAGPVDARAGHEELGTSR